ncbi:MAG: tripartite tricarboxylate transporter substrate binding protein [Treponema sp.]|jgi:tripartite-type tricarboxylate transporter receptor subunit TctC|nr:tripartite tricarboxylate transporter substrate binding protein [Treponema sp.]
MRKLLSVVLVLGICSGMVFARGAREEGGDYSSFPEKPVTVIVPWAVGGASDLLFRAVAANFPKYANGQQLIVKNVEGASSVVGMTEYMSVRPDGYTIAMWATAQTIRTQMAQAPYEATDFRALFSAVEDSPYILVHRDSPFQTVNDLVVYAKANPGRLTMGNSGAGGGNHLAALQFSIGAGIEVNHIPFGGGSQSAQATLAREIDCSMNVPAEGLTFVDSGDLRMLAIIGDKKMAAYPSVPTTVEMGLNVINKQTRGAVILKTVPEGIARRFEAIFRQICADSEFQGALRNLSMNPLYADGAAYDKMIADENELYKKIIQDNKLGNRY